MRTIIPSPLVRGAGLLALMLLGPALAVAAESKKSAGVARCVSDENLLLRREAESQPWRVVSVNENLGAGQLLVGGALGTRNLGLETRWSHEHPHGFVLRVFFTAEPEELRHHLNGMGAHHWGRSAVRTLRQ